LQEGTVGCDFDEAHERRYLPHVQGYVAHADRVQGSLEGTRACWNDLTEHVTLCRGELLGLRELARMHAGIGNHVVVLLPEREERRVALQCEFRTVRSSRHFETGLVTRL